MSKKRKAPAAAAAPKAKQQHQHQQQTRSRKAIARANRRARPRDDYYEAEDADAPDAHDTQRFDVSFDGVLMGRARVSLSLPLSLCAAFRCRHLSHAITRPSQPQNRTAEGRQLRVRDALRL